MVIRLIFNALKCIWCHPYTWRKEQLIYACKRTKLHLVSGFCECGHNFSGYADIVLGEDVLFGLANCMQNVYILIRTLQ